MSDLAPYVFKGQNVRGIMFNGEPIFSHADICRVLGIKNSADAINRLDDDEYMQVDATLVSTDGWGQGPDRYMITESGLYSMILGSRKAIAKEFKRWVTHEVLPSIRKTGSYGTVAIDKWADHPDMIATRRWLETNERVERVEITVNEQGEELKRVTETVTRMEIEVAPKVHAYDQFLNSEGTLTLKEVADRFGIDNKGRKTFMAKLRDMKILCKQRPEGGVSAYAQYYRKPKEYFVQKIDKRPHAPWHKGDETVGVTPAGVDFLARKLGITNY